MSVPQKSTHFVLFWNVRLLHGTRTCFMVRWLCLILPSSHIDTVNVAQQLACLAFPCKNFCVRCTSTLLQRHCCCLVSSAFEQTRSGNQLTTTSQWQRAMSDRGVQSCGSRLHLSTLFLGSRRAGSDSTISWSANTWFSMKLKSMITTSLFHLFLVWHVEPKARRKQVGQHGFHQGACHAVSLFRVWAFGCLNEEETWQPGLRGSKAFGNSVWQARSVWQLGTLWQACPSPFGSVQTILVRSPPLALFPHTSVLPPSRPSGNFPTSGCLASMVCSASWRQGMGWVDDMSELGVLFVVFTLGELNQSHLMIWSPELTPLGHGNSVAGGVHVDVVVSAHPVRQDGDHRLETKVHGICPLTQKNSAVRLPEAEA